MSANPCQIVTYADLYGGVVGNEASIHKGAQGSFSLIWCGVDDGGCTPMHRQSIHKQADCIQFDCKEMLDMPSLDGAVHLVKE